MKSNKNSWTCKAACANGVLSVSVLVEGWRHPTSIVSGQALGTDCWKASATGQTQTGWGCETGRWLLRNIYLERSAGLL